MPRTLCWFSCGAASAVATKLIIAENPAALPVRIIVEREHRDNWRFADDCLWWFERPIIELRDKRYNADPREVWLREGYLNGPAGARCSTELKKKVRQAFQRLDDIHVFGYHIKEWKRAKQLVANHPELNCRFPLIEQMITKEECLERVQAAGLALPEMYRLGYDNANCVGCVKGGQACWLKIEKDFPAIHADMVGIEETLGRSCIKADNRSKDYTREAKNIFLKDLKPTKFNSKQKVELPSCGMFCGEND